MARIGVKFILKTLTKTKKIKKLTFFSRFPAVVKMNCYHFQIDQKWLELAWICVSLNICICVRLYVCICVYVFVSACSSMSLCEWRKPKSQGDTHTHTRTHTLNTKHTHTHTFNTRTHYTHTHTTHTYTVQPHTLDTVQTHFGWSSSQRNLLLLQRTSMYFPVETQLQFIFLANLIASCCG